MAELSWERCAVHDDTSVYGFFGPYRFLSNFYPCVVELDTLVFPSGEHAYQAAKMRERSVMELFTNPAMTANEAKQLPKRMGMAYSQAKWDELKYDIMARVVFDKFARNLELREKLRATGDRRLSEHNWWKDTYWGYDVNLKQGENNLGKLLMRTRTFFAP